MNLPPLTYSSSSLVEIGRIVRILIRNKIHSGVVIREVSKPSFDCISLESENDLKNPNKYFFSQNQMILADFISMYYCCNLGSVYKIFHPFKFLSPPLQVVTPISPPKNLSKLQKEALNFALSRRESLIFGDTGSGKTEIYIHTILNALSNGGNVIFLMPEISLTPQMEKRLKEVFGDIVCIWHSKILNRKNILKDLQNSKFRIIVGARSALFLPVNNVKLIIVDEEHDDSYKSNSTPRYNARDLSIYLSKKLNIKLILGTATPSPTTYFNFLKSNNIFRLKGTFYSSKKNIIFENSLPSITQLLLEKITKTIESKKQVIIFIPIRANFKTIFCISCGYVDICQNCSVTLSFHSKKNAMICHYCGYFKKALNTCPKCSGELSGKKMGTQQICKELENYFKNIKISIFDRDEINTNSKLHRVLNDFNSKKIDILIGTQMISKGHDYHNVNLVVIFGIDYILYGSDFRAYERAFSLLHQISGRCGRKNDGEVFIQTLNENLLQNFLNDYEDFLKFEIKKRSPLYPPFSKLALIHSQNKNMELARKNLQDCKNIIEKNKNIEVVGIGRSPIEKIHNKWSYSMLVRASSAKYIVESIHIIKNKKCIIDIDPLNYQID